MHLQQSLVFMIWFYISDLIFSEPHILSRRFYLTPYEFFKARFDQFQYTRSKFSLDSLCFNWNRHCNELVRAVLRAETKAAALLIETAIFTTILQFAVKFWSIAWKWINFYYLQFSAYYSFGEVGKYFQILFRDGIYHWPEFIWYWFKQFWDRNRISSLAGTQDFTIAA